MRILFVTNSVLGAPELATIDHYPVALAQLGHDVAIVGNFGGNAETLKANNVQVFEQTRNSSRWYTNLRHIASRVQPEIVHVFIHVGCGTYPYIMQHAARSKFVLDIRSPLLKTGIKRTVVQAKNRIETAGYDLIGAHGIESAWTVVGRHPDIRWFPPGIDLARIPTRSSATTETDGAANGHQIRGIYVGALQRQRKITRMIEALALVIEEGAISADLAVDLYGYGEPSEIAEIMNLIRQRSLEKQIFYRGLLPREQLFERMATYRFGLAYVPTSLFGAGPPLKTLEYLAAGLPVLATDTIGNRLLVADGVNGLLADESPLAYADGLTRLLSDPVKFEQMAAGARASVETYDWLAIARERLLPAYRHLLA